MKAIGGLLVAAVIGGCAPRARVAPRPNVIPVASAEGSGPVARSCQDGLGDPLDAEQAEGMRIIDVCVTGGSADSTAAVRKALTLGPEKRLTAEALRHDLAAAYATGFIDQVEARARTSGSGAVIFLAITDRLRVKALDFEGLVGLARDPVLAEFPKVGAPLGFAALRAAEQKLEEAYVSAGWSDAKVTHAITPDGRVTITVSEGPRAKVGKVTFDGVRGGREADLRSAIQLETGAPLEESHLARATLLANTFYLDRGFLTAHIDGPKKTRAADGTTALVFPIVEGPMFRLGRMKVSKTDAATEKQILSELTLKPGDVLSRAKLLADITAITESSRRRGRPITIEPEIALEAKQTVVDVTLAVTEAP